LVSSYMEYLRILEYTFIEKQLLSEAYQ
jgi:hypothetical protein